MCDLGHALALCTSGPSPVSRADHSTCCVGRYQIKQVITVNVPGRVSENIKARLPTPSEMNLGLLTGKGAANPPPKPLSGLATVGACVSRQRPYPAGDQPLGDFGKWSCLTGPQGKTPVGTFPAGPASVL